MYDTFHQRNKQPEPIPEMNNTLLIVLGVLLGVAVVAGILFDASHYRVWNAEKRGLAELRQAEQNKQIRIEEARAQLESAKLLAEAEIERAKGVAEANKIIGESLRDSEACLRYLWVQSLSESNSGTRQIIYISTEAQLPLLEASRLVK
jgi:regulator of protease activity HflC (stomatin/prohibitin superfamily)